MKKFTSEQIEHLFSDDSSVGKSNLSNYTNTIREYIIYVGLWPDGLRYETSIGLWPVAVKFYYRVKVKLK